MRSLEQALYDHELIVLRVIGEWWDLDLTGADKPASVKALAQALAQLDMPSEVAYLPPEEAAAVHELVEAGGRIPVAAFSRKHGEIRLMGPGRLEREEPWLDPVSASEALWYRGFLYRAFDESNDGLVEFFYLPDDMQRQFPQAKAATETAGNNMEAVAAPERFIPAVTDAVDDLTALLATAQNTPLQEDKQGWLRPLLLNDDPDRGALLVMLAWEMELLRKTDEGARPTRAAVDWLDKSREEQLRALADAWSKSAWNDLCRTPGLVCEGSGWSNDPMLARTALLEALPRTSEWFRLADLVAKIKEHDPDFQRPDGNYTTWYIRDEASDAYVTGFDKWDLVEGRLICFLIQGPMFWLGLTETTAIKSPQAANNLYRLTPRAVDWLANRPAAQDEVSVPLVVQADATILVPFNANRYHRFQVARISQAEPVEVGKPFRYRLTPRTLAQAQEQGISPERALHFLNQASGRPIPTSTKRAVERWAERGTEGRVEQLIVLRVREAEILDKLYANPKTRPLLGERLADLAVVVAARDWVNLREAVAQLGLLLDSQ